MSGTDTETLNSTEVVDKILETKIVGNFLVWQALSVICCAAFVILIFLCCCISFRIPRTKQEIEADYVRKQIAKKFRKQLNMIQDSEMDEMDLNKAIERIRFELMTDEEKQAAIMAVSRQTTKQDSFIEQAMETPDKVSISSDRLNAGTSEEKLMDEKVNNPFSTRLVTIVNAFNVLRSKKSGKQITV